MAFGIGIYDSSGCDFIPEGSMSFIFFSKFTITIPANTPAKTFLVDTGVHVSSPFRFYARVRGFVENHYLAFRQEDYGLGVPIPPDARWKVGVYNPRASSSERVVDIYTFIPTYYVKWKSSSYGLKSYDSAGKLLFTTDRPYLDIKEILTTDNKIAIPGTLTKAYSHNIAVSLSATHIGTDYPLNREKWNIGYQASGKELRVTYEKINVSFGNYKDTRQPSSVLEIIDTDSYDGFNNLTWEQATVTGV